MRTTLLPERVLDVAKRHGHLYRSARALRIQIGRLVPPRQLPGLPGRVHFNDFMLVDSSRAGVESYRTSALNVMANIEESLSAAGRDFGDIESWIDFGSGYGRVIRFLVQRARPDTIFAADVNEEAVMFCASEFGVNPIRSSDTLSNLDLGSFDFFYAVSVLTHLNLQNSLEFLRLTHKSLNPKGIAMFTTHGDWSLEHLDYYGKIYEQMRSTLERRVHENGIAFIPYGHYATEDCGMTWHSKDWVRKGMRELYGDAMRLVRFKQSALYGNQDVFTYQRIG
jgi:SAM-dependent methyltransferase